MSPVAVCGTDTPLDAPNPDVNYVVLRLAPLLRRVHGVQARGKLG
jgi:hypothetical protein